MKFLNVFCEHRKTNVYISLEKIVLIEEAPDGNSLLTIEGDADHPVKVAMNAEALVRKINGEDKTAIGFRAGR